MGLLSFLVFHFLVIYEIGECALPVSGRYSRNTNHYDVTIPKKVDHKGHFMSHFIPHFHNVGRRKRSLEDDTVHYVVPLDGMVIEDHYGELYGNMSNLKLSRPDPLQCFYSGSVRDHNLSRVALSTCNGLAGYIKTNDDTYFIEPTDDENGFTDHGQVHVVFKNLNQHVSHCGTSQNLSEALREREEWELANKGYVDAMKRENQEGFVQRDVKRSSGSKQTTSPSADVESLSLFLEVLIAVDSKLLKNFRTKDLMLYLFTIINMVKVNLIDSTLGDPIMLQVVRLVLFHAPIPQLETSRYCPQKLLDNFCSWSSDFNPVHDKHPNHFDYAIFITSFERCAGDIWGVTNSASVCRPDKSCGVVNERGLLSGLVITHQIGHSLGADHDEEEKDFENNLFLMAPYTSTKINKWSASSRDCIRHFISARGWCLVDKPTAHDFYYPVMLPGQIYTAVQQCLLNFNMKVMPCRVGRFCNYLYCQISETQCVTLGDPPMDGTPCSLDMWCFHGACVHRGKRPNTIDGNWSPWSPWTICSRSCGGGVQQAHRLCNNPGPENGGAPCLGSFIRHRMCAIQPCDGYTKSFQDMQCQLTSKRPFLGRLHHWRAYTPLFEESICSLLCVNDFNVVVMRSPTAMDGTPCHAIKRNICVAGQCLGVGCDWVIGSKATEDACGICHGNGTGCRVVYGIFDDEVKGSVSFLKLPVGTSMISIRHLYSSECYPTIGYSNGILALNPTEDYFNLPGEFPVAGVHGVYQSKANTFKVFIRGPIKSAITVGLACPKGTNTGVAYQYALPERDPMYLPSFSWRYEYWTECSKACGGGTQIAEPVCIEQSSGQVDDMYCPESLKPPTMSRMCNPAPCTSRWWTGPWSKCDSSDGEGVLVRMVLCVRSVLSNLFVIEVVREKECRGQPKPRTEKSCNATKDREFSMTQPQKFQVRQVSVDDLKDLPHKNHTLDKYKSFNFAGNFSKGILRKRANIECNTTDQDTTTTCKAQGVETKSNANHLQSIIRSNRGKLKEERKKAKGHRNYHQHTLSPPIQITTSNIMSSSEDEDIQPTEIKVETGTQDIQVFKAEDKLVNEIMFPNLQPNLTCNPLKVPTTSMSPSPKSCKHPSKLPKVSTYPTERSTFRQYLGDTGSTPWDSQQFINQALYDVKECPMKEGLPKTLRSSQPDCPPVAHFEMITEAFVAPIDENPSRRDLPPTDEEFRAFGRLEDMPEANILCAKAIPSKDLFKILNEARVRFNYTEPSILIETN